MSKPVGAPSHEANNLDDKFFTTLVSKNPFLLKSFAGKVRNR